MKLPVFPACLAHLPRPGLVDGSNSRQKGSHTDLWACLEALLLNLAGVFSQLPKLQNGGISEYCPDSLLISSDVLNFYLFLLKNILLFICICVNRMCMCVCMCVLHMEGARSGDKLWELGFSFHHVGPEVKFRSWAWQQVPLPAEPSCWTLNFYCLLRIFQAIFLPSHWKTCL